jgi:hypothetical protein
VIEAYTAVVPSLGTRSSLSETIDSLLRQPWQPNQVILVLPRNTTRPADTPDAVTVLSADLSSSAQRNVGLLASKTPLVLFVDDDIVVDMETPRILAQTLKHKNALLAAATLKGDPTLRGATNILYWLFGIGHHNPGRGNSRLRWSGHQSSV